MSVEQGSEFLQLRFIVLALGELVGWWPTKFLSPTGLNFLERIYPRSAMAAAGKAAATAARQAHDQAVGRGSYHLFRLPDSKEAALDRLMAERDGESAQGIKPLLGEKEALTKALESMAGVTISHAKASHAGAYKVGSIGELADADIIIKMAALYLAAVKGNLKIFPYFEA